MPANKLTTLMTGATGFLGHFVLRDLLCRGRRVVALLRPPLVESSRRLQNLMQALGLELPARLSSGQLRLVEGSLPDHIPDLNGEPPDDILSCAAALQIFANGTSEPFTTNVDGTEALLDWARRHGVKRFHGVSTAYVCGAKTRGVHDEVFHHPRPDFMTDYERSKWLAESHMERWGTEAGNILTILRPSFLVGESTSGYTTQFVGFYHLARVVSTLRDQYTDGKKTADGAYIPLCTPGRPDDPQNLVPVDFASRIIAEIVLNPERHGCIYHLTNPSPPNNDFLKKCLEDYFQLTGGYFIDPDEDYEKRLTGDSVFWKCYDIVAKRIAYGPRFKQDNMMAVMRAANISFPTVHRERIFALLDYAVSQKWGQRARRDYA